MFNFFITRLPYVPVATLFFATGICFGGLGGLTLGILARDAVSILGGLFLGLVFGVGCTLFGLIFTAVFNALAPYTGGLPVRLDTPTPSPDTNGAQGESA